MKDKLKKLVRLVEAANIGHMEADMTATNKKQLKAAALELVKELLEKGYDYEDIIDHLTDTIKKVTKELDDKKKKDAADKEAEKANEEPLDSDEEDTEGMGSEDEGGWEPASEDEEEPEEEL